MKSYRRKDNQTHDYVIRYLTHDTAGHINQVVFNGTSIDLDEILSTSLIGSSEKDYPTEIISIKVDGKNISKQIIDQLNQVLFKDTIDECDGSAAGGDAGGVASGDVGAASSPSTDAGDIAGEMNGITTAEVLGTNKPGQGFFGKDNFYIPSRVKFPLHRWEICNGGSKRKKTKSGKPKKYEYEKGMKVVADMFEDESANDKTQMIDRKNINRKLYAIAKNIKNIDDVESVISNCIMNKDECISKILDEKAKNLFVEFVDFLSNAMKEEQQASWFAISMIATCLSYVLQFNSLADDKQIDLMSIFSLVHNAVKDEFNNWLNSKYNK